MSSLIRFQQEQTKKDQDEKKILIPQHLSMLVRYSDQILVTIFVLWLILSYILLSTFEIESELLLWVTLAILVITTTFWLKNKIYTSRKELKGLKSIIKLYFITLFSLNIFFVTEWLFVFLPTILTQNIKNLFTIFYIISILIFIFPLYIDINQLVVSKNNNSMFFIDFMKNNIKKWDPKQESTLINFLALNGIFIIFPFIIFLLVFPNFITAIVIYFTSFSALFIGYWFGYSIYRSYRWVQGYDPNIKMNFFEQFGWRAISEIAYSMLSSIWLFILILFATLNFIGFLTFSQELYFLIVLITLIFFLSQFLKILSNNSILSGNYSIRLNILILGLIPLFMPIFYFILLNVNFFHSIIAINDNFEFMRIYYIILLILAGFISFLTYRHKLNNSMWTDKYEGDQLLNEINLNLKNPKPIHLNLLAKVGLSQKDSAIIIKLLFMYDSLLEQKRINSELFETMHIFLLNEIEFTKEWRVHAVVFDLVNKFLEFDSKYYEKYYHKAAILIKHQDEYVRHASLNLLGHILHIDPLYADNIFPIVIEVYKRSNDELKKHNIEPLKYYARNFPDYREKLFSFVEERLEKEYFGVSTELMSILEEIALVDPGYFNRTIELSKQILTEPDSNAGLGAVRILVNNFPDSPKEGVAILKIMIEYLKFGIPEVKHHIVYSLGTLISRIPELTSILQEIDFVIYDDDANVRSALIQIITDLYPKGNIPEDTLLSYLQNGINDIDYVVRLLSIQRINTLMDTVPVLLRNLPIYLEKTLKDDNSDVFEEAYNIYQKKYTFLLNKFPKWVKIVGIEPDYRDKT